MRAPVGPLSLLLLTVSCVDASNSVVITTQAVDTGDGDTGNGGDELTGPMPTTGGDADDTTTGADVSTGADSTTTTGEALTTTDEEALKFDLGEPDPVDPPSDASTSTSTGSTGDESSTGESTGPAECVPVKVEPVRPAVVVVLSKGYLMKSTPWDHDGSWMTPTVKHWTSASTVLESVLTAHDHRVDFGLKLFPGLASGDGCTTTDDIEIDTAPQNGPAILAKVAMMSNWLKGGQPMTAGLTAAYAHLRTLPPGVPRTVIVLGNNAATCAADSVWPKQLETYDYAVHGVVADARAVDNITTHVVALAVPDLLVGAFDHDLRPDETNAHLALQQLAGEGGGSYTNAATEPELLGALDGLVGGLASCTLPDLGVDLEQVSIEIAGEKLLHVAGCGGGPSGWAVVDGAVQMCGSACAALKAAGEADVFVGCDA